ncbi:MAG: hypothetical protein AAF633_26770 [Chloroflexota bacterium]
MATALDQQRVIDQKTNVLVIGKSIGIWHDVVRKIDKMGKRLTVDHEIDQNRESEHNENYDVVMIFRDHQQPFETMLNQIANAKEAGSEVILTIGVEHWQHVRACFKAGVTDCFKKRPQGGPVHIFREIEYLFK